MLHSDIEPIHSDQNMAAWALCIRSMLTLSTASTSSAKRISEPAWNLENPFGVARVDVF